jgi:hypothetical protein
MPVGGEGVIGVVDALIVPPPLLVLLERHVAAVTLPPVGRNDAHQPRQVILRRGARESWRRSAAGGRDGGLRRRRADELELASASFFVLLSQDSIFMVGAVGDLWWCVRHRRLCTPANKALGGHRPRRA